MKGQMKIQQTTFMLIALTLFFVLVGLFVLSFRLTGLKQSADELEADNARLLVSKLANSPEFSCGGSFGTNRINCVDFDKAIALKENINLYRGFWGVDDIKIRIIYPESNSEVECTRSNYPNCNILSLISENVIGTYDSNFVALCRKEVENGNSYDKCGLALLMVSYEK